MAGFLITALALLVAAAPAHAVPAGRTVLVDRPTGTGALPFDGAGGSEVNTHALSGDGCFVVFESRADALLTTDDNAAYNVYRLDRCSPGTPIVQVNTAADGTPAEGGSSSFDASISSDGRKVVFRSDSHVLDAAGTTNFRTQVFVKDLQTGTLEVASRGTGPSGAPVAGNDILRGIISGDGNSVAFAAKGVLDAENVDGVDGQVDLYLRDLQDDSTRMVSVTTTGAAGGGVDVQSFDIDQTGSRAVFTTSARLDPVADTDTGFDAYVRFFIGSDASGSTQLISPGASAARVAMAPDSVFVAFTNFTHAFLTQCIFSCGAATQIDQPKTGGSNATGFINEVFFAPDSGQTTGRVYMRTSQPLDPADTDGKLDLYGLEMGVGPDTGLHLETGAIDAAVVAAAATDSGGVVVVNMEGSPHVLARAGGGFVPVSHAPGEAARIDGAGSGFLRGSRAMSDDGRVVAFESAAPVFGGSFSAQQVLVRDLASNTATLASVAVDGTSPADRVVFLGGLDGAGRLVTFASGATNLLVGVADGKSHVFVRDLATGTTTLVDRSIGGGPSSDGAFEPRISGDGRRVAFTSTSTDLPGAPSNGKPHVYLFDLVDETSVFIDQTSTGIAGDDQASGPDVDQTGRRVSFVSLADNLGAGLNPNGSVFVRDVQDSTTTWASRPEGGDPAQVFPFDETAISRDGTRVAFMQADPDFGFGATDDTQLFVHDLTDGSTVLASTGPLGAANEGVSSFALSGDGTRVAFGTFASNFVGSQPGQVEVFMRDLAAGTTSHVSLRDGATTGGRLGSSTPSLNLDGSCVAFQSASDDLVADGYGPDYLHVFLHAISAACAPGAETDAPPVVSDLHMERDRFRGTRAGMTAKQQAKRGTAFLFVLSERAEVAITIEREGRCKTKRCRGVLSVASSEGPNRVPFGGRFDKKALKPGKYEATVVATDAAGQPSAPATARFRIVPQ